MTKIEIRKALNAQILFCKLRPRYRCGIFVANKDKETMIYNYLFNTLTVYKHTRNKEFSSIEFPNGSVIKITQPNEFVRGQRYNGMIIDSNINDKVVTEIILPHLVSLTPYEFKDSPETTKMIIDKPSNRLYYCSICENDFKERKGNLMKVNVEREVDIERLLINLNEKSKCTSVGMAGYEVTVTKQLLRDAHDVIKQLIEDKEKTLKYKIDELFYMDHQCVELLNGRCVYLNGFHKIIGVDNKANAYYIQKLDYLNMEKLEDTEPFFVLEYVLDNSCQIKG